MVEIDWTALITNLYLWIGVSLTFICLFFLLFIFLIVLAKKTHAVIEFKAWWKGIPICLFFQDNRYVDWRPVKPEAGIITDKDYGAYVVNERGTYIDRLTKNIMIPFDAGFASSINMKAAKLADDFQTIAKDEEEMKSLRVAIMKGFLGDDNTIQVLKTSIHVGALKSMMNAIIPHNINAKIEKVIASRLKSYGNVNVPQIALLFCAMFGAILLGGLIIYLAF